jgi:hypothetical protein
VASVALLLGDESREMKREGGGECVHEGTRAVSSAKL